MHYNGSGILKAVRVINIHTVFCQLPHKPPIKLRHFHAVEKAVDPVQLPPDPVDRQAFSVQKPVHHHLSARPVKEHPLQHPPTHVNPVQASVDSIKVQSDHAAEALQDEGIGLAIRGKIAQIVAIAKDQIRGDVAVLPAAAAVGFTEEARRTLTHVRAHGVLTHLTAHTGSDRALVHIVARCFIGHETKPGTTGADEAGGCVGAVVVAVVHGRVCAFIDA